VRERQWIAQRREPLGLGVHELGHREPGGDGALDVLQRVVVGATEEPDVVAAEPAVPSKHVRLDALEGEPAMRVTVDIRDRRRDEETSLAHRCLSFLAPRGQPHWMSSGPERSGAGSTMKN
jgi:hypothetical protein